jgi:hypothetical protein
MLSLQQKEELLREIVGTEAEDQWGEVWTIVSTSIKTGSPIIQLWNRQTGQRKYVTGSYFRSLTSVRSY